MRRNFRKDEAEGSTKHGTIRSNGGVGQMKRTTKIQKKIRNLRNGRRRYRTTMLMAPSTVHHPLRLVVTAGRGAAATGKLVSHWSRESEGPRGSLAMRKPVN